MARWLEDRQAALDTGYRFTGPKRGINRDGFYPRGCHGGGSSLCDYCQRGGWTPGGHGRTIYRTDRRGVFEMIDKDGKDGSLVEGLNEEEEDLRQELK